MSNERTPRHPHTSGARTSRARPSRPRRDNHQRRESRSQRASSQGQRTQRTPRTAREVALAVLMAVRERDAYANLELPARLREAQLSHRDTALATELTYGTCRTAGQLDRIIAVAAGRAVHKIEAPVLDVLRLGAYQALYTRVEDHAAVDTTVELAKQNGLARAAGFINAVMRSISASDLPTWTAQLQTGITDPLERLAVGSAHPEWIVRVFAEALGKDAAELPALLHADDARPQVHLAARPGTLTAEELALMSGGEEGTLSPYAVYLPSGAPGDIAAVREHMATVQDEGSQLVAIAAARVPTTGPDTGRWLDLCAGPGGKAAMLGALAEIDGATVTAVEVAAHRARLVEQATDGLPVSVTVADGREPGVEPFFDRVLVDAPCSGLGALRRRPESRWRRHQADIGPLVTLQRELLASALRLVRPGGIVLYATCSPHLSETVSVVKDASRRGLAELIDVRAGLPQPVREIADGTDPWLQLWPHRHGTDAMFMAAMRRAEKQ